MNRGFTLIEVLISCVIAAAILTIVVVSFTSFGTSQVLDKETRHIVSILEQARSETLSSKNSEQYSVRFESNRVILFQGDTYSSSDPDNVVTDLNSLVRVSSIDLSGGGSSVTFNRLTGATGQFGTTTIELVEDPAQQKNIVISKTGIVEIQ